MSSFTPRFNSNGINGNRYWYSGNPFYQAGYGLPNCTCYAWGRFWEIAGGDSDKRPRLSTGNAEDWYNYSDGYERGNTPKLGATLCLADGPYSGDGHVCVVEEINQDGSITCSNSAYGGAYFYMTTLYPPNYLPVAGYVFMGFIYNPYAGDSPTPPTGAGFKWWYAKKILMRRKQNAY